MNGQSRNFVFRNLVLTLVVLTVALNHSTVLGYALGGAGQIGFGGYGSGVIVDLFTVGDVRNWPVIWMVFASYALVLGIIFPLVFKYKHNPEELREIAH